MVRCVCLKGIREGVPSVGRAKRNIIFLLGCKTAQQHSQAKAMKRISQTQSVYDCSKPHSHSLLSAEVNVIAEILTPYYSFRFRTLYL